MYKAAKSVVLVCLCFIYGLIVGYRYLNLPHTDMDSSLGLQESEVLVSLGPRANAEMVPAFPSYPYILLLSPSRLKFSSYQLLSGIRCTCPNQANLCALMW